MGKNYKIPVTHIYQITRSYNASMRKPKNQLAHHAELPRLKHTPQAHTCNNYDQSQEKCGWIEVSGLVFRSTLSVTARPLVSLSQTSSLRPNYTSMRWISTTDDMDR